MAYFPFRKTFQKNISEKHFRKIFQKNIPSEKLNTLSRR